MWVGSMTPEYVNYIKWAPRTKWEYSFTIYTLAELGNLGEVILPALHACFIVHPKNICRKPLFIPILFPGFFFMNN